MSVLKPLRVFSLLTFFCCHSSTEISEQTQEHFLKGVPLGKVDRDLTEASGLVASKRNQGMLWTHNDSGNPAAVFLIDTLGQTRMVCTLESVHNRDWEDITIGDGPEEGKTYVYVGDIGDNYAIYPNKLVYRFEEPLFDEAQKTITAFDTLTIKLSDGTRDMETMMIDPQTKDWFLISKEKEDPVHLYRIPFPYEGDPIIAQHMDILPLSGIVAANISADGNEVLLKNYTNVFYWRRAEGQSISELLKQPAIELAYKREKQGEAICFGANGKGYYTLSEGSFYKSAQLMYYKRK
jgi:hypothetical protein